MMTELVPSLPSLAVRGVSKATPGARRAQRIAALTVFLLPSIGVAVGAWQVFTGSLRVGEIALLAILYLVTSLGVTMGYHRHFAHKAFETSRTMQFVLVFVGSMAAQGPLLFWVATHRRHHAYSDRPGDPHSPNLVRGHFARLRGFAHAHIGWMLSDEVTSWPVFSRDLMRSPYVYWLHGWYWPALAVGLLLPAAIGFGLWGGPSGALDGLIWGGLVRIWLLNQASWCVGSISHMFGSRPFVTRDKSANNWTVALLTGGEGLQNNHHAFPSSALHGLRWYEPDLTGIVIRIFARLGLVWKVNRPSARAIAQGRCGGVLCHLGHIEDVAPAAEEPAGDEDANPTGRGGLRAACPEFGPARTSSAGDRLFRIRHWLQVASGTSRTHLRRSSMVCLSRTVPGIAARVALSAFLKPPHLLSPGAGGAIRSGPGTRVQIPHRGAQLNGRIWGTTRRTVLLMHGWGSGLEHLSAMVDPLVEAGYSVLAFDAPAHGESGQRHADILEFATAVAGAWRKFGPFHGMLGHSFGAASLLISIDRFELRPKRLVLIGAPASVVWLTQDFADRFGISRAVARRMRALMEMRSGLPWKDSAIQTIVASVAAPMLLVHDEIDYVVPYAHCERLAARAPNARVLRTRGRGHNGTLSDRHVIGNVVEFMHTAGSQPPDGAPSGLREDAANFS